MRRDAFWVKGALRRAASVPDRRRRASLLARAGSVSRARRSARTPQKRARSANGAAQAAVTVRKRIGIGAEERGASGSPSAAVGAFGGLRLRLGTRKGDPGGPGGRRRRHRRARRLDGHRGPGRGDRPVGAALRIEIREVQGRQDVRSRAGGDEDHILLERALEELSGRLVALRLRLHDLEVRRNLPRRETAYFRPVARTGERDRPGDRLPGLDGGRNHLG